MADLPPTTAEQVAAKLREAVGPLPEGSYVLEVVGLRRVVLPSGEDALSARFRVAGSGRSVHDVFLLEQAPSSLSQPSLQRTKQFCEACGVAVDKKASLASFAGKRFRACVVVDEYFGVTYNRVLRTEPL